MKLPTILTLPIIVGFVTLQGCGRPPLTPPSTPTLIPTMAVTGTLTPTAGAAPVETPSPTATALQSCYTGRPWTPRTIPLEVAKALRSGSLEELREGTDSRLATWSALLLGISELQAGNFDTAKELLAAAEGHVDLLSKDGQLALYFGQAELSCNLGQYDIAEQYRNKAQAASNSQEGLFPVTPEILPEFPTPSGWLDSNENGKVP